MLVFCMLCRITQSSDVHRTESVSVMDHEQTMGVNSRVLDQKQQNVFGRILLFWIVELQGYPAQLNGGDHDCALCIANIMCLLQAVMCMFKSLSLEKRNDVLKSLYVHLSSLGTVVCDLDGLFTVDVDLFTSQLLVSVNRLSSDEAGIKSV